MRLAILSDIHANLAALTTALAEVDRRGVDAVVCLGDVVGYGPDPAACLELVRARCAVVVRGNHDEAVATGEDLRYLPPDGRVAAEHHRAALSGEQLAWLGGLPLVEERWGATFVHATPDEPAAWRRLTAFHDVQAQFASFATPICFVGHSHVPAVAADAIGVLRVRPGHRFLVNVGSVGQPRDYDPRLSFAFYDSDAFAVEIVRLPYDVEATCARLAAEGLPERLATTLRRGG